MIDYRFKKPWIDEFGEEINDLVELFYSHHNNTHSNEEDKNFYSDLFELMKKAKEDGRNVSDTGKTK